VAFNSATSRPQNLPKELFRSLPGEGSRVISFSDKELREEEKVQRELVSLWSTLRWSLSTLHTLSEVDDIEDLKGHLETILRQQDLMAPFVEQRLLQQLSNTMLRRRDAVLTSRDSLRLQETTIQQMRSSSLIGPELLSLPQDIIAEETEIKSTKSFLSQLLKGAKAWSTSAPATRPVTQMRQTSRPSAAAGSAAQLADMTLQSSSAAPQWPHPAHTPGQAFKARRPPTVGGAQAGRGRQKGALNLSWTQGGKGKGKNPFPKGRGRKQ